MWGRNGLQFREREGSARRIALPVVVGDRRGAGPRVDPEPENLNKMENQTMTAKEKDNCNAADEARKPATQEDLGGVAGGMHDSRKNQRPSRPQSRENMSSDELADVVGGCGGRERRPSGVSRDELSNVAAGASRPREYDRLERRRDASTITEAG